VSLLQCATCESSWEATRVVCCPDCLARRWRATATLVRPKHDPSLCGERSTEYRSVVTARVVADLLAVLSDAALSGSWYYDTHYRMLVHMTPSPLGRAPGAGIPAGRREPEHALDSLFIAEADSAENAHVFAVDLARHEAQVRAGVFEPLGACAHPGCENLSIPLIGSCASHVDPSQLPWPA
jgi:hypothetical protein